MSRAREGEAYPEEVEEDEEYDEEEYDEEAEAAPRPARRRARARSAPEAVGPEVERRRLKRLSISFLAMLPLFDAYEWAVVETGGERRNAAELLLGLPLLPLGDAAAVVRPCLLGLCALAAFVVTRRRGVPVRVGTARVFLEGLLAALVMGPVLIGGMALFGDRWPAFDVSWTPPAPPGLARAALAAGGAGWVLIREEGEERWRLEAGGRGRSFRVAEDGEGYCRGLVISRDERREGR